MGSSSYDTRWFVDLIRLAADPFSSVRQARGVNMFRLGHRSDERESSVDSPASSPYVSRLLDSLWWFSSNGHPGEPSFGIEWKIFQRGAASPPFQHPTRSLPVAPSSRFTPSRTPCVVDSASSHFSRRRCLIADIYNAHDEMRIYPTPSLHSFIYWSLTSVIRSSPSLCERTVLINF